MQRWHDRHRPPSMARTLQLFMQAVDKLRARIPTKESTVPAPPPEQLVVTLKVRQLQNLLDAAVQRANTSDDELLNAEQAAALLGCSVSNVYRQTNKPYVRRFGRLVRFSKLGILAHVASKKS